MKWIGALLLIGTATTIGFEWSNGLKQRPKHIRQVINALQVLEAEMVYSQVSLQAAFLIISKKSPEPIRLFFQGMAEQMDKIPFDFDQIWEKQVSLLLKNSALQSSDEEILLQFGKSLGQHDIEQQQKHIHLTKVYLETQLSEAQDAYQHYGKLSKTLGILCGLFLVLLFI
ncbi:MULTISPECIES: stage III sporulation protein SpoIIIAB [Oceanobacillus]|uniref:Stage III sporulation protein AB n=1 Tax=Oceanobacillus kimchii TaxID=746691 RepID=A0ABQ5TKA1_9BACI|nr:MULTISPECIES: stage III sporulation protein SpoIIIAB [Oceanobacillus]MBT2598355.1 stage III sporulation protein SpoAB [Oceanobacillus sp. ISL-74]MBT2651273.1 stage III sporulation protein SpoAB [Oceanobacillus sp. ISL-73]MCT1575932.1 stage III sporulation protein SpoIIIAB [Oceanobacillus kimchii]MCT2135569.1 stage III sporulation protein SpoIIIAB [Oceanobacillus kimchii]OEH55672.1 stage III sporulation protein AB [Oceanobacillus sp. E9]